MSFLYFAYGSNMWLPRMRERCPSATVRGTGVLNGWRAVYDKPSTDGSAKLNIRPDPEGAVNGVVYEIEDAEGAALDEAEPRYTQIDVNVDGRTVLTYSFQGEPFAGRPYDGYVATVVAGARFHGLPTHNLDVPSDPDPGMV